MHFNALEWEHLFRVSWFATVECFDQFSTVSTVAKSLTKTTITSKKWCGYWFWNWYFSSIFVQTMDNGSWSIHWSVTVVAPYMLFLESFLPPFQENKTSIHKTGKLDCNTANGRGEHIFVRYCLHSKSRGEIWQRRNTTENSSLRER